MFAVAASAVFATPVRADDPTTQPAQTTEANCYSSGACASSDTAQCAGPSETDAPQCAGPISVQDPALTTDLIHDTDPWWLWVAWILVGGSFVGWGFRKPLLRAFREAGTRGDEDAGRTPVHQSEAPHDETLRKQR